ncbi:MAG TPA: phosphate propanoyltransferase [Bacillota bacterium]|nr:phosphate propanoyltransferase [Bacillota bacterium]HPT88146.1 phosphate propanoyltransferase [Bacillota bacterium]
MSNYTVPVGISNRHLHLSQEHLEILFGKGHELTPMKPLSQPGQYAAEEVVTLVGPKNKIAKVRVLGPVRPKTQVEISRTDSFILGVNPPVRDSGALDGSAGIVLEGPAGSVTLDEGVIIAQRHIHLHTDEAAEMGLKDKDIVSVKFDGPRGVIFNNVLVRVSPNFAKDFHLDTDEANAAGLNNGDQGIVLK